MTYEAKCLGGPYNGEWRIQPLPVWDVVIAPVSFVRLFATGFEQDDPRAVSEVVKVDRGKYTLTWVYSEPGRDPHSS